MSRPSDESLLAFVKDGGTFGALWDLARVCEEAAKRGEINYDDEWDGPLYESAAQDFRVAFGAISGGMEGLSDRIAALEAENARLRTALGRIVNHSGCSAYASRAHGPALNATDRQYLIGIEDGHRCAASIADAALAANPAEERG